MITLFCGDDGFTLHEQVVALRRAHNRDGGLDTNTMRMDGRALKPADFIAVVGAAPFLSDYRLVRVDGLGARLAGGGRRRSAGEWDDLESMLAGIPPTTILLFVDGPLPETNPLRRAVAERGEVRVFQPPRANALPAWLRARAQKQGVQMTPAAERLLLRQLGADLWALAVELDKLAVYAGDAPLDEHAVAALTPVNRTASIWNLVDAVAEGRTGLALQALHTLRQSESTPYLLGMLARQFRLITVAREVLGTGGGVSELRDQLTLAPYPAQKSLTQARRFPQALADAALRRVLACEVAIQRYRRGRPGGLREEVALDLLVHDLSRAAAG